MTSKLFIVIANHEIYIHVPTCIQRFCRGDLVRILFGTGNVRMIGLPCAEESRFHTILERDRWADSRTDRQNRYINSAQVKESQNCRKQNDEKKIKIKKIL